MIQEMPAPVPALFDTFPTAPSEVSADTIPKLVRRNAALCGERAAFRHRKQMGWIETSWAQAAASMEEMAAGLIAMNVAQSPSVFIIGGNEPEFALSEYAAQAVGSVAIPLFEQMTAAEMRQLLPQYGCQVAFAGTEALVQRILSVADELEIRTLVYWGASPLSVEDPRLITLAQLRECGSSLLVSDANAVNRLIDVRSIDDIGCVIFTSGTTGNSKGVLGSYRYMLDVAQRYRFLYGAEPFDVYLSYLPPAFSVEQYCASTLGASLPLTVCFAEAPATVDRDFLDSEAQFRFLGPRQWEALCAAVELSVLEDPNLSDQTRTELRNQLGLANVTGAINAGGSLSPVVFDFLRWLGIDIRSAYGFAEVGIITGTQGSTHFDTVGSPLPSPYGQEPIQIRSVDGEVQVKGGVFCSGYWGTSHSLEDSRTPDGWLRSGDAGSWDGSELRILDRLDNVRKLPNGEIFAPQPVEISALRSQYISQILLIGGHGSDSSIGALVEINEAAVRSTLVDHDLPPDFAQLSQLPAVVDLVGATLALVNATQPSRNRIVRFVNMPKPLTASDGELTRSVKLKRGVVFSRYDRLIQGLYDGGSDSLTATYQHMGEDGELRAVEFAARIGQVPSAQDPE